MRKRLPVMKSQCATCPFRERSPYAALADSLAISAMNEASRICHSTGTNAIGGRTGKKPMLCRGARDLQLHFFAATGFISEPTDKAWDEKCKEMGIK